MFAITRLAGLYTRGGALYGDRNWEKANSQEDIDRFKQSMWRHFIQFMNDEDDEDHFAAVIWNAIGIEHVKNKLSNKK